MARLELSVPHTLGVAKAIQAIKTAKIVPGDGWDDDKCTFSIPISGFQVEGEGRVFDDHVLGHLDLPDELEPKRDKILTNISDSLTGLFKMMGQLPGDDD